MKLKRLKDLLTEEYDGWDGDDYDEIPLPHYDGEFEEEDGGELGLDEDDYDDYGYNYKREKPKRFPNFSDKFMKLFYDVTMEVDKHSDISMLYSIKQVHQSSIDKGLLHIDITDDIDNNISYLPERYLERLGTLSEKTKWDNQYRVKTRIGRFLRKVDYKDNSNNNIKTIETFVSEYKKLNKLYHFEMVEGKEIAKWYLCDNYEEGGGSLNNSCMRYDRQQPKFVFYENIPEVCKMLIMKYNKNSDKILGRALIWKTNEGIYMDRIYTKNDADQKLFKNYAKENNYMSYPLLTTKELRINLPEEEGEKVSIFTKYINFFKKKIEKEVPDRRLIPYMDTFKYFYYEEGMLTNKDDGGKRIELRYH